MPLHPHHLKELENYINLPRYPKLGVIFRDGGRMCLLSKMGDLAEASIHPGTQLELILCVYDGLDGIPSWLV